MSNYAGSRMRAYFFQDKVTGKKRNTAIFATSAEAAKAKLHRPAPDRAKVYAVRSVKPGEARGGKWSRLRHDGKSPDQSSHRGSGFGP